MTLRHVVLISFPDGPDEAFLRSLDAGMAQLAADVPEILSACWGTDETGTAEHADYVMMFDFTDRAAYQAYRVHPAHQAFIRDYMGAVPMTKTRIQFQPKTGDDFAT